MMLVPRRVILRAITALIFQAAAPVIASRAQGDAARQATAFVQIAGTDLVNVVNSDAIDSEKKIGLQRIVDRVIDVDEFARFSLGRFWSVATPDQQAEFIRLFHTVLMNSLTGKLSQYAGVAFTVGHATSRDGVVTVDTVVTWPNYAPYNVQWSVRTEGGPMKIVDVNAMGTSMRLTQRNDYAGFMSRDNYDVGSLIVAMKRQVHG
jgi:phospholipid transport system substrate-binding protein